jgi:hypothetical protein
MAIREVDPTAAVGGIMFKVGFVVFESRLNLQILTII